MRDEAEATVTTADPDALDPGRELSPGQLATLKWATWAVPIGMLTVAAGYAAGFAAGLAAIDLTHIGLGAAGWLAALWLRAPVALVTARLTKQTSRIATTVIAASGPIEEGIRVLAVVVFAGSFGRALWLGFGWAAIEIVYTAVTAVIMSGLLRADDDRARNVRQALRVMGVLDASPAAGVLERASSTALHVGFTLLLAWLPWLAVLTAPAHSGVNLAATRLAPHSLALTQALVAVVGAAALASGILVLGHG